MKGLGRINIRKGFNAILITVILFTSLIFSLYFYFDKKQEYGYKKKVLKQYSTQNQKTVLKHEVESVINYIDYVRDEYKELPDSMIKMIAMKRIEKIRFEHGGYVFVNSYQGQALVYHGAVATGYIDVSDLTDPDGKKLFKLELKAANNPDGEYMTYKYKPIGSDSIMPKISFMKGYNDWQWIIGAGFYLQDINRELSTIESEYLSELKNELLIGVAGLVIICILMIILGNHYTHSLSKEINIFVDFFIRLSRNNKKIDTSVILFTEFRELAREANLMIEEKNKLEKELIESKENYSKLIDQAADAIIKADFDGNFIQVNPSFCLLTGFSEAQILKMNIKDLYTSEDLIKNPLKLNELNIGQEVINERSILTEQGHRIIVEINSKKIDKYTFLSIIRDISLRKKAEMELEEYRNYLENLVKERTVEIESKNKELTEKNEELERFNQLFVGREFRIKELRDKVKVLESQMKI